jgi:cobalt-precorrin-5B (C1)-methyltransferase
MASIASECMASEATIEKIRMANTARHVSEIVDANGIKGFHDVICKKVYDRLGEYSNGRIEIRVIMFEFDGKVKGLYPG